MCASTVDMIENGCLVDVPDDIGKKFIADVRALAKLTHQTDVLAHRLTVAAPLEDKDGRG